MIVKVETVREMALIREGKTSMAMITDKAKRTRPGAPINFWMGDPRSKKKVEGGALNFGTGKVSAVTDIEIKHHIEGLQPVGQLLIGGFIQSFDDGTRIARKMGFQSLKELYRHYEFQASGRLITWNALIPTKTTDE